jgi:hypothetical protein
MLWYVKCRTFLQFWLFMEFDMHCQKRMVPPRPITVSTSITTIHTTTTNAATANAAAVVAIVFASYRCYHSEVVMIQHRW